MYTKTVVATEDREISVPVLEQRTTLGRLNDASPSDAGMFLLHAFAWASTPAWSAHDIVSTARGRATNAAGESVKALSGANQVIVEQYVADGIAWLVARGLLGPKAEAHYGPYFMLTTDGLEAAKHQSVTHIESTLQLHSELHPALNTTARPNFERGDYATAVFSATQQVEIAVREAAGFGQEKLGTHMMRDAFKVGGPLADHREVPSEQEAVLNLFVGAIGAFKNPTSHRTVEFDSPIEAASIIHLADLLLRIVDRAKARLANEVSGE
ncbi:TIGR02391 family protein [Curtobacterium sp. BRB10]|uniref:TIGR02391 family protein n=1 Tax=Curtobacterium sp. BRB10 TaxID=2962579 RepID=UPI002882A7AC|nr:TIGR02391 family protein [Curtobacterium sp. BRB10]MDT0235258.1 TIGR02391 family protein [Curtobacterium sp. BRB10]